MLSIDIREPGADAFELFADAGATLRRNDAGWRDDPVVVDDPKLRLVTATRGGAIVGRLCAFVKPLLSEDIDRIGLIGWYDCADDAEAAEAILAAASELLAARGCTRAIGPINGDTWHRYRVALPSAEPSFFLDQRNPEWYAAQWRSAAFSAVADYISAEILVGTVDTERIEADSEEFRQLGAMIRSIDPARMEQDLETIHAIATRSFDRNFLYTPIALEEFLNLYRPVIPIVVPELVELAFDSSGEPVAFCFSLPDLLAPAGARIIAKTAGRIRGTALPGIGSHLIERVHLHAARRGCSSVVHALMHHTNHSRSVLGDLARPIREYQLYGRDL